jgi:predicted amidohydrolase
MRIGFCQFPPLFGNIQANLDSLDSLIKEVEADVIVLPELCTTGYQFVDRNEVANLSEPVDGPTVQWARNLASKRSFSLCGGFVERDGDRLFNSAFFVTPNGDVHTYRKIHLFNRETELFDPGDRPPQVFQAQGTRIGMMICFDWIFPETMRCLNLAGAQLVCHPSNLVLPYCQEAMKTRCLENQIFAVTANRIGTESRVPGETLTFTGASQITAPYGKVLARAEEISIGCQVVKIDPTDADSKNVNPYNNLVADRRPELYPGLCGAKK